jgi:hypothetical protein
MKEVKYVEDGKFNFIMCFRPGHYDLLYKNYIKSNSNINSQR